MKHLLKCLFLFSVLASLVMQSEAQSNKIDSLLTLLKTDKEDTSKVYHLNLLCSEYTGIGDYDTSIYYGNYSLQLAVRLKFKSGISLANNLLGGNYLRKGDYPEALEYYQRSLKINEELEDKKEVAKNLGNIGAVYYFQGNYSKTLDYYFKSLTMSEELGDKKAIGKTLGNIGIVYQDQVDYSKALGYYNRALKIKEELKDKKGIATSLGNIANIYFELDKTAEASSYFSKALKISEDLGDNDGIAIWLSNIGLVHAFKKDYDKALECYFSSLKISEEMGNKPLSANIISNIGSNYIEQKKYTEACGYIYHALSLSDSIGQIDYMKENYKLLSLLYEKSTVLLPDSAGGKLLNLEDMQLRALHYFKKYISLRDTIFSEESKKQLVQKEMNFEFEKKEAATKAEQDKKDTITQIIIYSVSAGFLLVLILSVFIYRSSWQKKKVNKMITEQKHLVEEKQKEILDSIHYAKRIQLSLLPTEKYIQKCLTRLNGN